MECTEPMRIPTLSKNSQMLIRRSGHQSPDLVNSLGISSCLGPTIMCFTLHRRAVIFKAAVPLLNLFGARGVVAGSLFNLSDYFHLLIIRMQPIDKKIPHHKIAITLQSLIGIRTWPVASCASAHIYTYTNIHSHTPHHTHIRARTPY